MEKLQRRSVWRVVREGEDGKGNEGGKGVRVKIEGEKGV